ncbi:TolC family protein [Candidatus Hydrogenedentota bacterium]
MRYYASQTAAWCGTALLVLLAGCTTVTTHNDSDSLLRGYEDAVLKSRTTSDVLEVPAEESELLELAALNNPSLKGAFLDWKAALEKIPQVKALPDPMFTFKYFVREVETRVGPQDYSLGIAQKFPWLGKLKLRGDKAFFMSEAKRERFEAMKLTVFYEVRVAFWGLYYLSQSIKMTEENLELLQYLEEVTRTRYETALGSHSGIIRVQTELGKLEDRLKSLRDMRGPATAKLNALLNRPPDAPIGSLEAAEPQTTITNDAQIIELVMQRNPELKRLKREVEAEEAGILLALKDSLPDITLGLQYINTDSARRMSKPDFNTPFVQMSAFRTLTGVANIVDASNLWRTQLRPERTGDSGKDPIALTLSMNMPIWRDKYRAAEREARMRTRSAEFNFLNRINMLMVETSEALFDFHDAERKIDLYRDTLIPKADESLKATETAYRGGQSGFLDLIDAQRILLDFQLSYEKARADYATSLARLEMLAGGTLGASAEKRRGDDE